MAVNDVRLPHTSRRGFLAASCCAATAGLLASGVHAATGGSSQAETYVGELFESLNNTQRQAICFATDHPSMTKAHANWHITKPLIGSDFYTKSQQATIEQIVKAVSSPEGFALLQRQMDEDDGGLHAYSMAIFGIPGRDRFQWVLTGRHLTLRADGNTMKQSAFGGPIVYGHGEESSPSDNVYYYQTQQINAVFAALDSQQREQALVKKLSRESELKPQADAATGIAASQLDAAQQELLRKSLQVILAPYRQEDSAEAMQLIEAAGFDQLRLIFAQEGDLAGDRVWDMWRIESPVGVIHFRGAPHVHAYIQLGKV